MAPLPGRSPFVPESFRHGGFVYMMYKGGAMYMMYNNCTKVRRSREVDH